MAEQADIEDSNIANYGSAEHKAAAKSAAETEKAWKGAGAKPGIQIWRINQFKVEAWPKDEYGSFYDGDSFIILYTYKDPESEALKFNVHFWLGKDTTQDEAGTAAYKTVELDDLLGDTPVQYREVQGSESAKFLQLFNGNIVIMSGGVDSGFNHVKAEEFKPKLMWVRGKGKAVTATEVACSASKLNAGDVFILDCGSTVYQWNGPKGSIMEKRKAMEVVAMISDGRRGKKPSKVILDGLEEEDGFWGPLGGMPESLPENTVDEKADEFADYEHVLMSISDASGSVEFKEVARGAYDYDALNSGDVYILDVGMGLGIWVGTGASKKEKSYSMVNAMKYLSDNNRPAGTQIYRVVQGGDEAQFKMALALGKGVPAV